MTKIKVAINGFGRIGRMFLKLGLRKPDFEIAAINDLAPIKNLVQLLKFDSAHGKFNGVVSAKNALIIDGASIPVFSEKDPSNLPWKEHNIDIVIESTGKFRTLRDAGKHLEAGARKVIISAPGKDPSIPAFVLGINENDLRREDKVISNASCTTNCLGPMVDILDKAGGIISGYMNTVHAYTADQNLLDGPHSDLRRARSAAQNIIPTSTGAAKAIGKVLPHLDGKIDAIAMRVPVIDGSIIDLTCKLERNLSVEEINSAFKSEAQGRLNGILAYSEDPLVSSDIIGNQFSCIFDSEMTKSNGDLVRIIAWYDNETGFSARLTDLCQIVAQNLEP